MTINPDLYPQQIADIESLQVEAELNLLEADLIASSLKQVSNTRNIGQLDILNFLRLVTRNQRRLRINQLPALLQGSDRLGFQDTINTPYPENINQIPSSSIFFAPLPNYRGTGGYLWGGFSFQQGATKISNLIQKLSFDTESITISGTTISIPKTHFAVSGQTTRWWSFGGWQNSDDTSNDQIEKFNYLDQIAEVISTRLTGRTAMASATSTPEHSYIFGGINNGLNFENIDYPFTRVIEQLGHLSTNITTLGSELFSARSSERNLKGDSENAYLLGGLGIVWSIKLKR